MREKSKRDILFVIAVLGFFGIQGLDLLNMLNQMIVRLGSNGLFLLLVGLYVYDKNK